MEMTGERFWEHLKKHPVLRKRFESILDTVENTDGDCIKADDAEERKLGQEVLQDGADGENNR